MCLPQAIFTTSKRHRPFIPIWKDNRLTPAPFALLVRAEAGRLTTKRPPHAPAVCSVMPHSGGLIEQQTWSLLLEHILHHIYDVGFVGRSICWAIGKAKVNRRCKTWGKRDESAR